MYFGAGDRCRRGEIACEKEQGGQGLESHVFRLSCCRCLVVFWLLSAGLLEGFVSTVLDLRISVKATREKRDMGSLIQ